jgi:signal transduction histidine kinase
MKVRLKISLLITAAGFLSSLVFSCIILWEMLEQPFRIIDSELKTIATQAIYIVSKKNREKISDLYSYIGDKHYWLAIYDPKSGKEIYLSHLARMIKIPKPVPGSSTTASVIIPQEKIDLGQDRKNEVTFRIITFKIPFGGKTFLVTAARPIEKLEEELWDILIGVVSGLIFSVFLLIAISYFFAGFILKPIKIINKQARDISEKNLNRRIPVSGSSDEFDILAKTLNQVFDRLQHAFLRQKRLLADASHELKTPLTMMRLALDEIRSAQDKTPSKLQDETLRRLTEQVLRMDRLIKSLLDLSKLEIEAHIVKVELDLVSLLKSLLDDYLPLAQERNIYIKQCFPSSLKVFGDSEKLYRAFSNILDNAIKYNFDGGRIEVSGEQFNTYITIKVANTGPGVPESENHKVFEQFYRGEKSRSIQHGGTGLGLAIVKRIVELHSGEIDFKSQQGGWTVVTVRLPRHRKKILV